MIPFCDLIGFASNEVARFQRGGEALEEEGLDADVAGTEDAAEEEAREGEEETKVEMSAVEEGHSSVSDRLI